MLTCAEVCGGAWRCTEVCRRIQRVAQRGAERCAEVHRGVQRSAQRGMQRWAFDLIGDNREFKV